MARPQFSLKTLLLLMAAICVLTAASAFAWRLVEPVIHPHPVRTWTVDNGTMVEHHTEWSDGSQSMEAFAKGSQFSSEAEFRSSVERASRKQVEAEAARGKAD